MGSRRKQTIGYRYYMSLHMGIGICTPDGITHIKVGDREAWTGLHTDTSSLYIDKPSLFGGEKGEGGIQGTCDVLMGAGDQTAPAKLAALYAAEGLTAPGFRGICSLFFDGLVSMMNPYPKKWAVRHHRRYQGWYNNATFYPEKVAIDLPGGIRAMNPAHIIYQCITDPLWGRGIPYTMIDLDSFRAAADTLYAEGFGMCIRWNRQDSINSFIQLVQDHIGANVFTSTRTGKIVLRLIREDYDVDLIPTFGIGSGLLSVDEEDNSGIVTDEIIVTCKNPIDAQEMQVRVQNAGAIIAQNGVVSDTRDYPGLPTAELALRVAQRDLRAATASKKYKIKLDRRGYAIEPGGVFKIIAPQYSINQVILRAGRVEDGTTLDGPITITAVIDQFGLPENSFVGITPPSWAEPDITAYPVVEAKVFEAPYRELYLSLASDVFAALDATSGYAMAVGRAPTDLSRGFDLYTRIGAAEFAQVDREAFTPSGKLAAPMPIGAVNVTVVLDVPYWLEEVAVGSAAMIDDEIFRVVAIDTEGLSVTLARGCADTVPAAHEESAIVWFFDGHASEDPNERVDGDAINCKLATFTGGDELALIDAPTQTVTMDQRSFRPYPPGDFQINGQRYPAYAETSMVLTWAHRDRVAQADQLVDQLASNVGPEAGTTYTVEVRKVSDNSLLSSTTGIVGTTTTVSPAYNGSVKVLLWAVRDGLASYQAHTHIIEFVDTNIILAQSGAPVFAQSGNYIASEN